MEKSLIDIIRMQKEYENLGKQLDDLSNKSPDIQKALKFREELGELLKKHGFSEADLIEMLSVDTAKVRPPRKKRPMLRYANPHTGEHVDTKGGNHKTLNEWREKYGADVVDGWKKEIS